MTSERTATLRQPAIRPFPAGPRATDTRLTPRLLALLLRIQSEYREMPGLKLTEAQARRLWTLDDETCRLALSTLLDRRFLKRTAWGSYVRASG